MVEREKRSRFLQPFDVRPALAADTALIKKLVSERFGDVPLANILLLNKTGGVDRADLVIMHGERFGWLTFDPVSRKFSLDIAPNALPFILSCVKRGIVDLDLETDARKESGRIGGKKIPLKTPVPDGTAIVKYKNRFGTGVVKNGSIRIKETTTVIPRTPRNPGWGVAVEQNRYHLKNLERNAIRSIKHHIHDRQTANVSFSGGKDSTAVLRLARKAGVTSAFFIDTGIEFPETVEFVQIPGCRGYPESRRFLAGCGEGRTTGKRSPLVLQITETAPPQALPRRDWSLCYRAGKSLV